MGILWTTDMRNEWDEQLRQLGNQLNRMMHPPSYSGVSMVPQYSGFSNNPISTAVTNTAMVFGGCVSMSATGWSPTTHFPVEEPLRSFEGTVHGCMEIEE